jgi:hypothetical protein
MYPVIERSALLYFVILLGYLLSVLFTRLFKTSHKFTLPHFIAILYMLFFSIDSVIASVLQARFYIFKHHQTSINIIA